MKCPPCPETTLLITDKQGVEIDYCPSCRDVWLDRGELDKLMQLAESQIATPAAPASRTPSEAQQRPDFHDSDYGKKYGGHRRKSWLSEIFA